jgi:hypothetical protein
MFFFHLSVLSFSLLSDERLMEQLTSVCCHLHKPEAFALNFHVQNFRVNFGGTCTDKETEAGR